MAHNPRNTYMPEVVLGVGYIRGSLLLQTLYDFGTYGV